jgi:DNA polymerase/3'-5' exonuclease PolX
LQAKEEKKNPEIIAQVVNALKKKGYVLDIFSQGKLKFIGMVRLPGEGHIARQLDLKLFPWESVPAALLHLTGSGEHNRQMRYADRLPSDVRLFRN